MTENRVVAEGVHKAFGDNKVLKGVSFTVEQGTATTIIGPSGSGKTTLLRTLNALDRADAGVIRVDDIEIDFSTPTPKPEVRRFQSRQERQRVDDPRQDGDTRQLDRGRYKQNARRLAQRLIGQALDRMGQGERAACGIAADIEGLVRHRQRSRVPGRSCHHSGAMRSGP